MDPWEFPPTAHHTNKTDEAGSKDNDYFTELLFGRNLTKSSLDPVTKKCWRTAYIFFKDQRHFLDDESESSSVSIGCCVDLFPLVKKVLTSPYEDYLVVD
ncbi:KATNB1-like protein 1 [Oncorhynchus keta]|uniref:KATNB1-like protein 1 n=1 Tax=Oncorhynchus keta TaxID=8018 RepID=UPI00227A6918|nr:KATNB1-like protein 1 [Oncorhynchus keta]XP_052342148.1 KATNB1-like protein 1 [Oncorhynchus keta]XP_052342149.1 KATNB1-like protein 1 [Oncorhynchus keta]